MHDARASWTFTVMAARLLLRSGRCFVVARNRQQGKGYAFAIASRCGQCSGRGIFQRRRTESVAILLRQDRCRSRRSLSPLESYGRYCGLQLTLAAGLAAVLGLKSVLKGRFRKNRGKNRGVFKNAQEIVESCPKSTNFAYKQGRNREKPGFPSNLMSRMNLRHFSRGFRKLTGKEQGERPGIPTGSGASSPTTCCVPQ